MNVFLVCYEWRIVYVISARLRGMVGPQDTFSFIFSLFHGGVLGGLLFSPT